MTKFIIKCLIVLFVFMFGVTFSSAQNEVEIDSESIETGHVLTSSTELYANMVEDQDILPLEKVEEQESMIYHLAQFVEKSGLMIYDGMITIVTDIARVI